MLADPDAILQLVNDHLEIVRCSDAVKHLDDILGSWPWLTSEVQLLVMLKKMQRVLQACKHTELPLIKFSFEPGWFTRTSSGTRWYKRRQSYWWMARRGKRLYSRGRGGQDTATSPGEDAIPHAE